jgi:hypothetical protein
MLQISNQLTAHPTPPPIQAGTASSCSGYARLSAVFSSSATLVPWEVYHTARKAFWMMHENEKKMLCPPEDEVSGENLSDSALQNFEESILADVRPLFTYLTYGQGIQVSTAITLRFKLRVSESSIDTASLCSQSTGLILEALQSELGMTVQEVGQTIFPESNKLRLDNFLYTILYTRE